MEGDLNLNLNEGDYDFQAGKIVCYFLELLQAHKSGWAIRCLQLREKNRDPHNASAALQFCA